MIHTHGLVLMRVWRDKLRRPPHPPHGEKLGRHPRSDVAVVLRPAEIRINKDFNRYIIGCDCTIKCLEAASFTSENTHIACICEQVALCILVIDVCNFSCHITKQRTKAVHDHVISTHISQFLKRRCCSGNRFPLVRLNCNKCAQFVQEIVQHYSGSLEGWKQISEIRLIMTLVMRIDILAHLLMTLDGIGFKLQTVFSNRFECHESWLNASWQTVLPVFFHCAEVRQREVKIVEVVFQAPTWRRWQTKRQAASHSGKYTHEWRSFEIEDQIA